MYYKNFGTSVCDRLIRLMEGRLIEIGLYIILNLHTGAHAVMIGDKSMMMMVVMTLCKYHNFVGISIE